MYTQIEIYMMFRGCRNREEFTALCDRLEMLIDQGIIITNHKSYSEDEIYSMFQACESLGELMTLCKMINELVEDGFVKPNSKIRQISDSRFRVIEKLTEYETDNYFGLRP